MDTGPNITGQTIEEAIKTDPSIFTREFLISYIEQRGCTIIEGKIIHRVFTPLKVIKNLATRRAILPSVFPRASYLK